MTNKTEEQIAELEEGFCTGEPAKLVNALNKEHPLVVEYAKDLTDKIKQLQERNKDLVDQHEAEIMYYEGKIGGLQEKNKKLKEAYEFFRDRELEKLKAGDNKNKTPVDYGR